jgi:hypothetical protein
MKLVTNIIGWSLVLAIPAFLFVMFWIGTGIQMGQCDMLRVLEIDELITAEERIEMEKSYDCTN